MGEQNAQPRDGGPAFPMPLATHEGSAARLDECTPTAKRHLLGMTLRDYFAAKAMTALIDGYDYEAREKSREAGSVADRTGFDDNPHADSDATYASQLADEAYIIADAMLTARNR